MVRSVRNAIWYIYMKCNLDCPYCSNRSVRDRYRDLPFPDPEIWAEAWNRIDGDLVIDITGGEPFLWRELPEFIHLLDEDKAVAISTNGTRGLTDFIQKISPQRCVHITLSYHPTAGYEISYFIGKVLMLIKRGFNANINFVAYPEQMWLIPYLKELFGRFGIDLHIDPYIQNPNTPYYSYTEEELDLLEEHLKGSRRSIFERKICSYACDAGSGYFIVTPDGDVYPCTALMSDSKPIGNLLNPDFKLLTDPLICSSIRCDMCDLDHTVRIPLNDEDTGAALTDTD